MSLDIKSSMAKKQSMDNHEQYPTAPSVYTIDI